MQEQPNIPTSEAITEAQYKLVIVDDEPKPLAGTDIIKPGCHQYTKLALVRYPQAGPDRYFCVFAESQYLYDRAHDILNSPEWIRDGFDQKWIYIEEVDHRPGPGETLDQYMLALPQNENYLWVAVFNKVLEAGILEASARKIMSKTYGLPADEG